MIDNAQSHIYTRRRLLTGLMSRLPHRATAALFVTALNITLKKRLPPDVYRQLLGKGVEIVLTDWGTRLCFKATPSGFVVLKRAERIALSIRARGSDFGQLASGDEDADTLYFNRRLVLEGDTELALLIKNTLDALDGGWPRALVRRVHRVLSRMSGKG